MSAEHATTTGLLFSGGVDSAVLLDLLLRRGGRVVPIYIRTGCAWEDGELVAAQRFLTAIAQSRLMDLVTLEMPLGDLYGDHWSITGIDVPDETSPDEAVYLPGRNPLLLVKPAIWCWMHRIERLALATLAGNQFEDATPAFFARFEEMFGEATQARIAIDRPFAALSKRRVMEMGRLLPLDITFSCLAPAGGLHCGRCNKCDERRRAFRQLCGEDPTPYAAAPRSAVPNALLAGKHTA
jgi:7-cyano-7-deazaguanine synthase